MLSDTVKNWNDELTKIMNESGMKTYEQQFESDLEGLVEKYQSTLEDIAMDDMEMTLDDDLPDAFEAWYVNHTPQELVVMLIKYYERN